MRLKTASPGAHNNFRGATGAEICNLVLKCICKAGWEISPNRLFALGVAIYNRGKDKAVSKVIDPVILNLFQDPNALYVRSRSRTLGTG